MITNAPTLLVVQHVDREGPDLVGTLANERGMTTKILRPNRGDTLPDPSTCPNTIALVLGGPPQHQCDCVWAGAGIGEGIASVWSQDFGRHSPLVGEGANQVRSLAINVLHHQQGGGVRDQSSR